MKLFMIMFALAASGLQAAVAETVLACQSTTNKIIHVITIPDGSAEATVRTLSLMARCTFENSCPATIFRSREIEKRKYELTHDDGYVLTTFVIDLGRMTYDRTLRHKGVGRDAHIRSGTETHKGPCEQVSAAGVFPEFK